MSSRYASPIDLTREPWWPRARGVTFSSMLDLVGAVVPSAANTLVSDLIELHRSHKGLRNKPFRVDTVVNKHTLGSWVDGWRPIAQVIGGQRLAELRRALDVLGGELDKVLAPPPKIEGLGPLAQMNVRVLAERRQDANVSIPGTGSHLLGAWGPPQSVADFLETPWVRSSTLPAFLQQLAGELVKTLEREAPARSERLVAWEHAPQLPAVTGLLALRQGLAATETPVDEATRTGATVSWDKLSDEIVVKVPGLLACLTGPCEQVTLSFTGDVPVAACRRGEGPCRMKLAAVERMLDFMTGVAAGVAPTESGIALREHLAVPTWQRMLLRLRAAGTTQPVETRRLGWVLKSRQELVLSWITPTKKGNGWKAANVNRGDMDMLALDRPADSMAMSLTRGLSPYAGDAPGCVGQALAALAGSDNVYMRLGGDLVAVEVLVSEPRVEVVQGPDGSRVVLRLGDAVIDDASHPRPGHWTTAIDEASARVHVGFWSRNAHRAWLVLGNAQATALPTEAVEMLAETLMAIAPNVAVKQDASWLGQAHAPAEDVVFRLGLEGPRGNKVLTVEGCVQPVPELGPLPPGEGQEVIALRRDGQVGHVLRAFERERAAVALVARQVGLEARDDQSPFVWHIEGLEAAVAVWTALTDSAAAEAMGPLRVEWKTKKPQVQRNRRIDKLRLKLGLKKDWLDVRGGFQLDGGELPLAELLQALRDKKRFVQLDDERVLELGEALKKELAPLEALMRAGEDKDGGLRASMFAAPLIAELETLGATVQGPPQWLTASKRLAESVTLKVGLPAGLVADLRPYQREGLEWAARLAHWARGACLADEMGLGKTLQALALLLRRRGLGRALVVAPTSVVPNWLREAARFAPSLRVAAIARGTALDALDDDAQVVVTSWDLLVRHEERFGAIEWGTVVLDEAHAMKNASTRRAQVAKGMRSEFVLALTGTPVENRPSELWSLFQAVAPGLLGSAEGFRETYARAIEGGDADAVRRLARLVRPFILRRKKSEVASDLPATSEVRVDVVLGAEERERYERVRKSALAELAKEGLENNAKGGQQILRVLVVLTRLRQLACHPRLVDPKAGPNSAKLERLLELMTELRDESRKVLIFSQFTELLALVRVAFDTAGLTYAYLDGSTPAERRIVEVDRFQGGTVDAFLLSLKAGGVGLNLTAASEVIHLDPWWNPAVEDQATGRAHRIGQDKPVTVYRLVAQGTIEEQILGLHGDKRAMVASLLEGTGSAKPVTVDELLALLSEEGLEASAPDLAADLAAEVAAEVVSAEVPRKLAEQAKPWRGESNQKISVRGPEPAVPAAAAASKPVAKVVSATATGPLERVLATLKDAAGRTLKKGELLAASNVAENEWQLVRDALERDTRIEASGVTRGRGYRWMGAGTMP